ncbi:MAG TPA: CRISPR-associated endonuclease Cas1 [Chthoniobacterales bacterium]
MSPSRRAISRIKRLQELGSRVSGPRTANISISPGADVAEAQGPSSVAPPDQPNLVPVYLPARMINEFVYCPRLFYYEQVEGVFLENADTIRGSQGHKRVDQGTGALASAGAAKNKAGQGQAKEDLSSQALAKEDTIHARSVEMASDRLGVICKMDLVEIRIDLFSSVQVCPVEYKAGSPRENDSGIELWDTDKIQLALQCLILRDNGYDCKEGILYYRSTKQRVRLEITPEIETWTIEVVANARACAQGERPSPLVASPKCVRCSLAPVCLPDETNFLRQLGQNVETAPPLETGTAYSGRRSLTPRDERRALYLNSPGLNVGRKGEVLEIRDKKTVLQEVRIRDINHIGVFGNIQISTQVVQELCEQEVPITYFSGGGRFYGITHGLGLTNVFTRIAQFQAASDERYRLALARYFVAGKIRNQRTMLMRNHEEPPAPLLNRLREAVNDALLAQSLDQLLGIEGAAAANYFGAFCGMLKPEPSTDPQFTFDFRARNRRPPRDPVNALLSLGYSLLAKDCAIAAASVGFDPYVGLYHQPRFGRPALALDIMEEFRPLIADSVAVTLINNRMLDESHFVRAGNAANLTDRGRKIFFEAYESRLTSVVTHPVFEYKVAYRRAIELQFRLLARVLVGEIAVYRPFVTR